MDFKKNFRKSLKNYSEESYLLTEVEAAIELGEKDKILKALLGASFHVLFGFVESPSQDMASTRAQQIEDLLSKEATKRFANTSKRISLIFEGLARSGIDLASSQAWNSYFGMLSRERVDKIEKFVERQLEGRSAIGFIEDDELRRSMKFFKLGEESEGDIRQRLEQAGVIVVPQLGSALRKALDSSGKPNVFNLVHPDFREKEGAVGYTVRSGKGLSPNALNVEMIREAVNFYDRFGNKFAAAKKACLQLSTFVQENEISISDVVKSYVAGRSSQLAQSRVHPADIISDLENSGLDSDDASVLVRGRVAPRPERQKPLTPEEREAEQRLAEDWECVAQLMSAGQLVNAKKRAEELGGTDYGGQIGIQLAHSFAAFERELNTLKADVQQCPEDVLKILETVEHIKEYCVDSAVVAEVERDTKGRIGTQSSRFLSGRAASLLVDPKKLGLLTFSNFAKPVYTTILIGALISSLMTFFTLTPISDVLVAGIVDLAFFSLLSGLAVAKTPRQPIWVSLLFGVSAIIGGLKLTIFSDGLWNKTAFGPLCIAEILALLWILTKYWRIAGLKFSNEELRLWARMIEISDSAYYLDREHSAGVYRIMELGERGEAKVARVYPFEGKAVGMPGIPSGVDVGDYICRVKEEIQCVIAGSVVNNALAKAGSAAAM